MDCVPCLVAFGEPIGVFGEVRFFDVFLQVFEAIRFGRLRFERINITFGESEVNAEAAHDQSYLALLFCRITKEITERRQLSINFQKSLLRRFGSSYLYSAFQITAHSHLQFVRSNS